MVDRAFLNRISKISSITEADKQIINGLSSYYALFENINGGGYSCTIDFDLEFSLITDGLLRLKGMNEQEFRSSTANSLRNMIYSADSKWATETILSQLQVGDRSEVTYRITDEFGAIKWVHDVGQRVIGPDGNEMLFGTVTDVTEAVEATQRLNDASYELETLMTNIPGGICVFEYENGRMKISYANEEYFVLNGFTSEYFYMIGDMDISRFIADKDYPAFQRALESSLENSSAFEFEYRVNRNDDVDVWVSIKARVFKYHGENPVFYSVIWDTTARKKIENELYLQTERYKAIEENTDEVPFEYVIETDTLIVSKPVWTRPDIDTRIYNFYRDMDSTDFIHPDSKQAFKDIIEKSSKWKNSGTLEYQGKFLADGEYHWYILRYANVLDENGKPLRIVGRVNNNDEKVRARLELENRLMHDDMTSLYNKSACEKLISEKIESKKESAALLVVDIDNFKLINDTFGHTFGDTVIQNFAQAIQSVADENTIVGRIGGDEFLLYLPIVSHKNATDTAEHICNLIKQSYVGEQLHLPDNVGCSIGISYIPDDGNDFPTVFDKADLAMYSSKANGKNRWSEYNEKMKASAADIMSLRPESKEIVQRSQNMVYDSDFVTFAFSLLSHSRDVDSSINILLERIGKRFDISFVAVLEDIKSDGYMHFTNIWHYIDGIQPLDALPPLNSKNTRYIAAKGAKSSLYVINNTEKMTADSEVGEFLLSNYNCHAFAGARFPENNMLDGCLFFTDCEREREWSEFELGTISELARVMSVFVSLRRERIRSHEQIQKLSSTDALTGLFNQTTFIREAEKFIENYLPTHFVALIYTDINGFSYVNENFGYEAGDKMLCDFADAISTDTEHPKLNGRVYSDYFITISASKSRADIINAVENINNYFIRQQSSNYPASNLSLSTGVYFITSLPEHSLSALIENSNLARKEAKLKNQSFYIYDDELSRKRIQEQRAANDMHKAIETGKLRLFLQPKFSLKFRVAVGAEALVRWILPDGTMRYPDSFIPILTQIGYITELDFFIFEQTLKYIRKWLDEDKRVLPISVNFARQHLNSPDFVKTVYSLTQKYNVPPEYIEIEITESESVNDNEHFLKIMEQFHSMGFKIDIDDFGTGYSSLSMLLDAPFDVVKIDKSFITDVEFTPKYTKYLETLIKLIKTSDKDIIFEGVETEQQARTLLKCGCDIAQGFLFNRAISADEFEEKYISRNK